MALGYSPDGQADAIAASSDRKALERGPIKDQQVLQELVHRLGDAGERIRARMDRLGELDAVSQDVLVGVLRELEEQLWMTRAQLPQ